MVPAGGNPEHIPVNAIHEAVLVIDSPAPKSRQVVPKRLRFADPAERFPLDILNQGMNPGQYPAVSLCGMREVSRRAGAKSEAGLESSVTCPASEIPALCRATRQEWHR